MRVSSWSHLLAALSALQSVAAQSDYVLAGYHVIWSYAGTQMPQQLFDAARAGRVGGIILFGENISNVTDLTRQIDALQTAYSRSPAYQGQPLLITTDQEGGKVNRLPGGPVESAKQVGQSADPAAAGAKAGDTMASVFSTWHVNSNLAPVLDVYRTAGDFTDRFQRSYGNTSALVSKCVGPLITALQSKGYPATAKHFPGLGAAGRNENTDEQPVTINLSLEELRSIDEQPYITAITAGLKMIMPSWAIYPSFDSKYPSGLSRKWLQSELRGRLGFEGVIVSDAIEAGALSAFGDTAERTVLAVQAGTDIVLAAARNVSQGQDAVEGIVEGLQSGQLDRADFDASTKRIVDLRSCL